MSKVGKFRQRSRHFILKKELKISNSGNKKYLFFWTFGNSTDFDFCRSVFLFGKLFCVSYDLIWAQKGRNCQKCRTLGSINTNWKLFQKGRNCQKCRTLGSRNTNEELFQKGRLFHLSFGTHRKLLFAKLYFFFIKVQSRLIKATFFFLFQNFSCRKQKLFGMYLHGDISG